MLTDSKEKKTCTLAKLLLSSKYNKIKKLF
jgi:hypothetical protein